jgi:putative endonuclease
MYLADYLFYIYITTNPTKTTLYVGVTNNVSERIIQHYNNRGQPETFAGKYYCYNLIYFETFEFIQDAIAREKQLKKWSRKKKEELIATRNSTWIFLNKDICGCRPPK